MTIGHGILWASRVVVITLGLGLLLTPQASADAAFVSSDPAEGVTLTAAPAAIKLTFNEPVSPVSITMKSADPTAAPVALAAPSAQDQDVTQPLPALANGAYTLSFQVTSADGHDVSGAVTFIVVVVAPPTTTNTTAAPTTTTSVAVTNSSTPAVTNTADNGERNPSAAGVIGATLVVFLLGGAGLYLMRRRKA